MVDELNKIPDLHNIINYDDIKVFAYNDLSNIKRECQWMFVNHIYQIQNQTKEYDKITL